MGEVITIKEKQFKPYISQQQIKIAVKSVSDLINAELKNEQPFFLVVLNGAFMFASDLLKEINIPSEVCFIKVASYQGTSSNGNVTELIGLTENVAHRTVVIIEDIVDTGLTIDTIINTLNKKNVKQIKVATAFMKPASYTRQHKIDYIGFNIQNDFVVGYGLDFDGLGRNLKEVYVLV